MWQFPGRRLLNFGLFWLLVNVVHGGVVPAQSATSLWLTPLIHLLRQILCQAKCRLIKLYRQKAKGFYFSICSVKSRPGEPGVWERPGPNTYWRIVRCACLPVAGTSCDTVRGWLEESKMGTFCLPSDQKDMLSARQQYCQHFADSDCSIKNRLATSRPCHFSTTTNMGGVKGSRSTITGMRVMLFFALAYLAICGASVNAAPSTGQPSSKGGSGKASGNNENGVIPSHTTNRVPMDSPMQQTEAGRPKPVQTPNSQRAPTRAGKSTKRLDVAVIIVMRVFSMYSTRYQRQCAAPNCARSALAYYT